MKKICFKEWLKNEEMTSSACVATVPMRWGQIQRRKKIKPLTFNAK